MGIPTAWPSFHVRRFQNRLHKGYWLNMYLSWLHHQTNMNSLLKSCDVSTHNLYLVIRSGPNLSELSWHVKKYDLIWSLPRYQSSWGQHGAHLGPIGPRWAPCWSHELCYQGICPQEQRHLLVQNTDYESINPYVISPKLHKMVVEVFCIYHEKYYKSIIPLGKHSKLVKKKWCRSSSSISISNSLKCWDCQNRNFYQSIEHSHHIKFYIPIHI